MKKELTVVLVFLSLGIPLGIGILQYEDPPTFTEKVVIQDKFVTSNTWDGVDWWIVSNSTIKSVIAVKTNLWGLLQVNDHYYFSWKYNLIIKVLNENNELIYQRWD